MKPFQKLWVRFRIYLRFSKIRFTDRLSYRTHFFLVLTEYLLIMSVNYFLWKAILTNGKEIQGFSLDHMVTYVAIAGVFRFFINEFSGAISHEMRFQYQSGALIMNLLKPVSYPLYIYFHAFGGILFHLFFRVIPVLTFWALIMGFSSPKHLVVFIISLGLGVMIYAGIAFLVGLSVLYLEDNRGIIYAVSTTIELLSGTLIPIAMFPMWFVSILDYFPFKLIFYRPMEIYFGRLNSSAILTLVPQVVWVFVLSTTGWFLFKRAIRKLTIQGG